MPTDESLTESDVPLSLWPATNAAISGNESRTAITRPPRASRGERHGARVRAAAELAEIERA